MYFPSQKNFGRSFTLSSLAHNGYLWTDSTGCKEELHRLLSERACLTLELIAPHLSVEGEEIQRRNDDGDFKTSLLMIGVLKVFGTSCLLQNCGERLFRCSELSRTRR